MIKAGYKQTEVGVIPEDWDAQLVKNSYEICNNLRFPLSEMVRKEMQGSYPYYGPTKIQSYIDEYRVDGEYCLIGEDGDHFLKWQSMSMTLFVKGRFNVNNHAHLVRGVKNETEWFYYYFHNRDITKHLTRQGASRYKLTKASLANLFIAIPSAKEEQTAIAKALSDTDALIQSLSQLIAKKRQIKQGAMQSLLSPYDETGALKAGWGEIKLEDVGSFRGGNGFPTNYQGNNYGRYPFYKVSDMNKKGNEIFMSRANNYIDKPDQQKLSLSVFPEGTIVFAKIGAAIFLERKKILSVSSIVDNNMMGFLFDKKLYSVKYIYYLFRTIKLGGLANTTALPSLSGKDIGELIFYIPLKTEQNQISQILTDMDTEITTLETKLSKYQKIKQGMMQNLLTGRIRLVIPSLQAGKDKTS